MLAGTRDEKIVSARVLSEADSSIDTYAALAYARASDTHN
jgi:hypothetical protein